MTITYGSVCSGIEAASVAWEILGWHPSWFSQFDPDHDYKNGPDFPSAVLACRWPEVKNLGDMTKIAAAIRRGEIEAPDVLVGGTPCQAFSVAGLRNGLTDKRGQLTLHFVELVNAIDKKRREQGKPPAIVVWENVPGVFSSRDNAFGCFLAGLAGESCELESPGKKWTNAGYVLGPERAVCWRVLDAQFFGVAQRRRRVFVVAYAFKAGQGAKAGGIGWEEEQSPTLTAAGCGLNRSPSIIKNMAVRRLTPIECERLQGFPDNHTLIPRDKRNQITADEYAYVRHHNPQITAEEAYRLAKDGPRYKAIGNSMAVPVMRWIGKRIAAAIKTAGERS